MSEIDIEAFRSEVRQFLAEALTPDLLSAAALGFGISRKEGTAWHQALYKKGWVAPDWPVEQGLSLIHI